MVNQESDEGLVNKISLSESQDEKTKDELPWYGENEKNEEMGKPNSFLLSYSYRTKKDITTPKIYKTKSLTPSLFRLVKYFTIQILENPI